MRLLERMGWVEDRVRKRQDGIRAHSARKRVVGVGVGADECGQRRGGGSTMKPVAFDDVLRSLNRAHSG